MLRYWWLRTHRHIECKAIEWTNKEKNGEGEQTNEIQFHFIGILSSLYLTIKYIRNSAWCAVHSTYGIEWTHVESHHKYTDQRRRWHTHKQRRIHKHIHTTRRTQHKIRTKKDWLIFDTLLCHISRVRRWHPQKSYLQFKDKRIYFVDIREYTSGLHHWET